MSSGASHEASAVELRDVRVALGGREVVRNVDAAFAPGSVTAILGPSGCGKTTLLRMIAGFLRPDSGAVLIQGNVVADDSVSLEPERRGVGIVAQEGALFPTMTVERNVAFGVHRHPERDAIVRTWIERVGLAGHERKRPSQLSGGQQQRVALARALAPSPSVVLLDEPFSSLDVHLRERLRVEVTDILRAAAVTAIVVTHDREEAMAMADGPSDRIAVMFDGRIAQIGAAAELHAAPTSVAVGSFLGELLVLPSTVTAGATIADTALGRFPVRSTGGGSTLAVALRPEQLCIVAEGVGTTATVQRVRFLGTRSRVDVRLDDGVELFGYRVTDGTPGPQPGERIGLSVSGTLLGLDR